MKFGRQEKRPPVARKKDPALVGWEIVAGMKSRMPLLWNCNLANP
jgi:hypothetical protein